MSDHGSFPPPGAPPPPGAEPPPSGRRPDWGTGAAYAPYAPGPAGPPGPPAPPGAWQPAPGMLGAAHKPGAIPLRPLGLGDLYDGAFRIIRYNPKVLVGAPVLVAAGALLVPVLLTVVLTWVAGVTLDPDSSDLSTGDTVALVAIIGSFVLAAVAQAFGMLLVTAMIAHVVQAAAVGRRLGIGEAWRATHGKRWRVVGLALLLAVAWLVAIGVYVVLWAALAIGTDGSGPLVLFGLVTGPLVLVLAVLVYIRITYLAIPALVLEDVSVLGAIGRAYRLTSGAFWRTLGIAILTAIIAQVGSALLTCPLGMVAGVLTLTVPSEYELFVNLVLQAVTTVLSAALVTPFTTSVSTLQYVDLRMRKEAFDVELMHRAGVTAS